MERRVTDKQKLSLAYAIGKSRQSITLAIAMIFINILLMAITKTSSYGFNVAILIISVVSYFSHNSSIKKLEKLSKFSEEDLIKGLE